MRYAHISAPIVSREVKDEKTGIVTVTKEVQRPGTTLRLHADRRLRLTMERIQRNGAGRGAWRRGREAMRHD